MNRRVGIRLLSAVGSAWILSSSIVLGFTNGSVSIRSVVRVGTRQRQRLWPEKSAITLNPFTANAAKPLFGSSEPLLQDVQLSPQTTGKIREEEDPMGESPSYLKPALFVGGALAVTAVMIRTDQQTYNIIHGWRTTSDPLEDVSPAITNLGDGRASMVIFGGLLAYSFVENDRTALQAGRVGLESFLLSGIVTQILKHTFGRQRPMTSTESGGRWNGAYFLLNQGSGKRGGYAEYDAFPSGHTATIFAAATTLAEVFKDSPWVSYASYTVASSVAISRIMESDHWLSDCFVGGLIGYFSTQVVLHYNHSARPVALVPTYNGKNVGLALNVGF